MTAYIKTAIRANLVQRSGEIIPVFSFNMIFVATLNLSRIIIDWCLVITIEATPKYRHMKIARLIYLCCFI